MFLLRNNVLLRTQFIEVLKAATLMLKAYFFEAKPVNSEQYDLINFEFVLIKAEKLITAKTNIHAV